MKETDESIRQLLRESLPPAGPELSCDLWPRMLRRLDEKSAFASVPWFDWALLGTVLGYLVMFPHAIPLFLYHL